jgi:hypothetical protein
MKADLQSTHSATISVPATVAVIPGASTPERRVPDYTVVAKSEISPDDAVRKLRDFAQSILDATD